MDAKQGQPTVAKDCKQGAQPTKRFLSNATNARLHKIYYATEEALARAAGEPDQSKALLRATWPPILKEYAANERPALDEQALTAFVEKRQAEIADLVEAFWKAAHGSALGWTSPERSRGHLINATFQALLVQVDRFVDLALQASPSSPSSSSTPLSASSPSSPVQHSAPSQVAE